MKRQRGRNRGGGGGGGGGGKSQAQNANRAFDSNGPEGAKVRGNAQHVFEKYQQLARDAQASGDRVLGENYLQHAEHYFRLLRAMQPTRPASEILGRDHFSSGFDIDFEDETAQAQSEAADQAASEAGETAETWQGQGGQAQRDDRSRDDRPREDRQRDERPRYENRDRDFNRDGQNRDGQNRDGQGRRERWRDDRPRDERPRDERLRDDRPRDDRPRDERSRDDRPAREDRGPREDRPRYSREDRPQREPVGETLSEERGSPVLRDSDGGESHAPAFLQASAAPKIESSGEAAAPKPRRRRPPKAESLGGEDT